MRVLAEYGENAAGVKSHQECHQNLYYYEKRESLLVTLYHDGALRMKPVKQPDRTPANGMVAIHLTDQRLAPCKRGRKITYPAKILTICSQLTALNPPDMTPTPVVAPTIHMVVETGIPN
jgi:hypothetical protein